MINVRNLCLDIGTHLSVFLSLLCEEGQQHFILLSSCTSIFEDGTSNCIGVLEVFAHVLHGT